MNKLLLYSVIALVVGALVLLFALYRLEPKKPTPPTASPDGNIPACADLFVDPDLNKGCLKKLTSEASGDMLFFLGKVKDISKKDSAYEVVADLSHYEIPDQTFRAIQGIGLCTLQKGSLNAGMNCNEVLSDSNTSSVKGKWVLLLTQTRFPRISDPYFTRCQDHTKKFISALAEKNEGTLNTLRSASCLPVLAGIYY